VSGLQTREQMLLELAAERARYWLLPVSGFDEQVVMAPTKGKAKWVALKAARSAGYFEGKDGGARYFASLGHISELGLDEVRSRIGGHKPIGAPEGWGL
jgi:hypothetical protein